MEKGYMKDDRSFMTIYRDTSPIQRKVPNQSLSLMHFKFICTAPA